MISDYRFGQIKINGQTFNHDVFIDLAGNVKFWWRQESHRIDKEDITQVIEQRPEILIIGTGAFGIAKVTNEAKQYCSQEKIELIIKPTPQATKEYNRLKQSGKKVAAFFHLTC